MGKAPAWCKIGLCLLCLALLLQPSMAFAQFHTSGDDPASLKWSQMQVGAFNLIYPRQQESLAYHYAAKIQAEMPKPLSGLRAELPRRPIPVLLHAYSADANAMVAWPPRRMEFFTIPSPSLSSSLDWSRTLVWHEGRHVAQYQRSTEGIFRALHFLIGEQSEGLAALYYASPGFYEGDAVFAESVYSHEGRGRQAEFLLPYRAYFADSIDFSYDKWQFGSYRHYIPNEYALGYFKQSAGYALNAARLDYPYEANAKVYDHLSRGLFQYRKAYTKAYGMYMRQMWAAGKTYYEEYWREDSLQLFDQATRYQHLIEEKDYNDYRSSVLLDDGKMILHKATLGKSPRMILFDPSTQTSRTLFYTGRVNSPLRANQEYVYWTENISHPRWQHQSYSVLCAYPLADTSRVNARYKYLTTRSLFFHPSPSPDGRFLALVEADISAKTRLLILRLSDMTVMHSFNMPAYDVLKESVWSDDDKLYFSVLNEDGLRLDMLDLISGAISPCLPPQARTFRHLSYHDGYLYFDADFDATTQIYRYQLKNATLEKLTQARFSASQAKPTQETLYFLDYDAKGNIPASMPWTDLRPALSDGSYKNFLVDDLLAQQPVFMDTTAQETYEISQPKPYHKLTHLLHFHSWAPLYYDKDQLTSFDLSHYYETVAPGLSLFTQNDLGTAYGQLGYSYHGGYHALHARFTYSGWYPIVSLQMDYNDESSYRSIARNDTLFRHSPAPSLQGRLLAYVPLQYRRQAWTTQVVPSLQFYLDNNRWYSKLSKRYEYSNFMLWQLQLSTARDKAQRDIKSPLHAGMTMGVMHPLTRELYYTPQSLFSLYGGTHVGILSNDVLSYKFAAQRYYLNSTTRMLMNPLLSSRGFEGIYAKKMRYHALDYTFPLNMDLSIPNIVYIKRLETTLFAEMLHAQQSLVSRDEDKTYRAVGVEASFNLCPLRINFALNIGFRATLSDAPAGSGVEMVLNVPYL